MNHRQRRGDQHPQATPLPLGIVGDRVADRSTGFIQVRRLLLADRCLGLFHHRRQAFADEAADGRNGAGAELNAEHLIKKAPHLAMAQLVDTAKKGQQSAEQRAIASSPHNDSIFGISPP